MKGEWKDVSGGDPEPPDVLGGLAGLLVAGGPRGIFGLGPCAGGTAGDPIGVFAPGGRSGSTAGDPVGPFAPGGRFGSTAGDPAGTSCSGITFALTMVIARKINKAIAMTEFTEDRCKVKVGLVISRWICVFKDDS